ncbi:Transposase, Ptta/En/Spm, plant [Corchorus olitorius]|uniref:Transposase, Ptta/En/Spm, plant n=1 Tax=Corchorus olitorius TaxID=93759 RepID=A0A1R3KKH7_9ROSI|nr:Transposase, Ptta/En/Spm, plant [Corchorus olitorius]
MAKSKQGDGSKTDPKKDKEKGKRKVNPQPPPPSAPKKTLCMPPAMNGAVKTRGIATASGSTSQQQPEPASHKVFRLQPPPRRTETSPLEDNVNSSSSQLPTTNGSTSQQQPESEPPSRSVFRFQPPPRQTATSPPANVHPPLEDNDEEEEQEEDEMDEEGVDRDELDHDLEAREDAADVQHDQQQQPVKLPPYPGLRDLPMEPLPSREVPEVPPLELSENMLYGYGYYRGAWPGWSFILRDVKKEMFETFKVYYTWPKSREKEVRSVFSRLASDHIRRQFQIARETLHIPNPGWILDEAWDIIRAYWRSPQFKALQEQNKKNRNADGFASTSGYRGGRISTYTHRQRFTIEKHLKPTRVELYERTHGNGKNGTYPPGRKAITTAKFKAALERAKEATRGDQETLRAIDEDAIFDEVAGGTKGRRLDLGNIARAERCGVVDPCSSLTQEKQELWETIKSLSQDNEATKAKQMQSDRKLDKLQKLVPDDLQVEVSAQLEEYKNSTGDFGMSLAIRLREKSNPDRIAEEESLIDKDDLDLDWENVEEPTSLNAFEEDVTFDEDDDITIPPGESQWNLDDFNLDENDK